MHRQLLFCLVYLANPTLIHFNSYQCSFAVHLIKQQIHLFPCLFIVFLNIFSCWCFAGSCSSVLAYKQKSCGQKCFLMWSDSCDLIPRLPHQAILEKHISSEALATVILWHSLACELAPGYTMPLLIVNSQQFHLSLRPHCYWYKARTLRERHMAGVSGNLTDGGLITSQNTSVLSIELKDPAD